MCGWWPILAADFTNDSKRSQASGANSSLSAFFAEDFAISTPHSFIVYIDEGGDDGIRNFRTDGDGGTSPWLVIGGCIVSVENDSSIPRWRDDILSAFPSKQKRDLHFKDLKGHEQKLHVCREIAKLPVRLSVIMSNKTTIPTHPRKDLFEEKNTLYWYLCRYLVERVSAWCATRVKVGKAPSGNGMVKLIFSRRGGLDYEDFRKYLLRLKEKDAEGEDPSDIDWSVIDIEAVEALDHSRRAGLQIADTPPSAFLRSVCPDHYGGYEPHYAKLLEPRMMQTANGIIIGSGVKPVPRLDQMTLAPAQSEIFEFYRRSKKR